MPDGLKYVDVAIGDGAPAENGKTVSVHYTGWLMDGTKFDSSLDRGQPIQFVLGTGHVIKGWDEGLLGMRVGGKRTLTIPPDLGYGQAGAGGGLIPPNATLKFDVQLVGVN
jgi:FKBP-type peptidyl-prolyl cis-trans isomerase FkpA